MISMAKQRRCSMEPRNVYDVIIVGSGPAGAGAARALTESGLAVLIAEREALPRFKMCSGIVFPSGRKFIADHFGTIPDKVLCSPERVMGNRIYATLDAPPLDVPFAVFDPEEGMEPEALNCSRSELDHWLCSQSDADLVGGHRFDDFEVDGQGFLVHLQHRGRRISVRTRYLVGADGTLSQVRRRAFPGFDAGIGRIPNYEEFYLGESDLEPGWLHLFFDRSITGYFATVFHDEGRIQLVTGVHEEEPVKKYFQAFRAHLEAKHGLVVKEKVASHGIVLTDMSAQRNTCLGSSNLLLAGEAGGFLRGGEGITSSMTSGRAAGLAILESVESGRPAIEHFRELAAEELRTCELVHERLTKSLGFNIFKRQLP
jgi:flavin-dependent dehydrogenase